MRCLRLAIQGTINSCFHFYRVSSSSLPARYPALRTRPGPARSPVLNSASACNILSAKRLLLLLYLLHSIAQPAIRLVTRVFVPYTLSIAMDYFQSSNPHESCHLMYSCAREDLVATQHAIPPAHDSWGGFYYLCIWCISALHILLIKPKCRASGIGLHRHAYLVCDHFVHRIGSWTSMG